MRLAHVYTRALVGISAPEVTVEVHIASGLPALSIVGLPEAAVRESKDRVRAAIQNSCFEFPMRRITVNLAPADLPKQGGRYDLPIALGILAASGQIKNDLLTSHEFHGELALSGNLRSINGSLPAALGAQVSGRILVLPSMNAQEAALAEKATIKSATSLLEICQYLQRQGQLHTAAASTADHHDTQRFADMSDVRGQYHARRALEIAAAGQHNMLMVGPPGTGKSMLACRLPGILPPMTEQQALESAAIHSISQQGFDVSAWKKGRFVIPITPHPVWPWSVAAPIRHRVRYHWRIMACSFLMNSHNSIVTYSMFFANPWKQAASPSRALHARRNSRQTFS